jgi:hypothetical protein
MEMFVKCSGLQSSLDRFLPRNGEMENCMISTRYQATRNGLFFFFFSLQLKVALQIVFFVTTRVEHIRTDLNRSVLLLLLDEEEESMHLCN